MGLDMYLTEKVYVGGNYAHNSVEGSISVFRGGNELRIPLDRVTYVEMEAVYWRKANAIHKWFVDNVQDGEDNCAEYYVSQEQLKDLYEIVCKVLSKVKTEQGKCEAGSMYSNGKETILYEEGRVILNPEVCEELLPSEGGFFFGNTEYNEWYLNDLEHTKVALEELDLDNNQNNFFYTSSW